MSDHSDSRTIVLGSTIPSTQAELQRLDDVYKGSQKGIITSSVGPRSPIEIDYSWLPFCADTYEISPNIEDYTFVSVPILTLGTPNRNLQAFAFSEVSNWDVNQGKPVYRTFVGKPTFTNHKNNTVPHLAKGVHFDAALQFIPEYNLYKVMVLLGFDRKKDPGLCAAMEAGKGVTGYSMGAMVDTFMDSWNGKHIGLRDPDYNRARGQIDPKTGKLRYVSCCGVTFFETSCLGDFGRGDPGEPPADHSATSDAIWR